MECTYSNVNSIYTYVYTKWGKPYNTFKWIAEWEIFINLSNKEIEKTHNNQELISSNSISYILYWFDENVLHKVGVDLSITLDIRIRIICGMINKLNLVYLTRELKQLFMECIWNTYRKFRSSYNEWYCYYILQLPF